MIDWTANVLQNFLDFSDTLNASIAASWLILVVVGIRPILKKTPKWINVALWGIVALRLLMPFSIESGFSLIPSVNTVPDHVLQAGPVPGAETAYLDIVTNPSFGDTVSVELGKSISSFQWDLLDWNMMWFIGMAVMILYTAISYISLRVKLRFATKLRDNIYQCVTVDSPFVLGILKPKIYLPYEMVANNLNHVIAHEQAHIRRFDHWWKPLGFLLLTIHWFNPLMWVAYCLLCRDIELACDEKVIAELDNEQRADYTKALVACSVNRRRITACPLAFGEISVKERVKNVMHYRKPGFWIVIIALIACAVVAVCFLTDPNPSRKFPMKGANVSDLEPEGIVDRILDIEDWESSNVYMNSDNFTLTVDSEFNWSDPLAVRYFFTSADETYSSQLRIFPEDREYILTEPEEWPEQNRVYLLRHFLEALKYLPQDAIREMAPADRYIIEHREEGTPKSYERVISYTDQGVCDLDGWFIHLRIHPLHWNGEAYHGTGEEVIEVFYGSGAKYPSSNVTKWFDYLESPEEMDWNSSFEITLPEFPGVKFRRDPYKIEAITGKGIHQLFMGMPIWNTYFCDLTGDGLPDLCSTLSFGSGMIDNRVIIYDYANGVSYELSDRGFYDYTLRLNEAENQLYVDKAVYPDPDPIASGPLMYKNGCIQVEGVSTDRTIIPDSTFGGTLNLGLNAEIVEIDPVKKILYVKDLGQSSDVFGDRCAIDCTYAISRYNLLYVNYGDPNDVRTIDFSAFGVGDSVIIGMYDSELEKAFNGSAVAEQIQLATQRLPSAGG